MSSAMWKKDKDRASRAREQAKTSSEDWEVLEAAAHEAALRLANDFCVGSSYPFWSEPPMCGVHRELTPLPTKGMQRFISLGLLRLGEDGGLYGQGFVECPVEGCDESTFGVYPASAKLLRYHRERGDHVHLLEQNFLLERLAMKPE